MVSTVNLLTHASILPISVLFLYFAIHSRRPESIFTAVRNSDDKICFASLLSSSANSASSFAISSSGTVEGSLPSKASFPPMSKQWYCIFPSEVGSLWQQRYELQVMTRCLCLGIPSVVPANLLSEGSLTKMFWKYDISWLTFRARQPLLPRQIQIGRIEFN